jgi:hypothetical protein
MFVTSVSIRREGYYGAGYGGKADPAKPFNITIEIHGKHGKVELALRPELSESIIALVAAEVAEAGRATAEAMTASFVAATPALEAQAA